MVEIVNGDAIMVKRSKNDVRKIHLASIRPPRLPEGQERPRGTGANAFRYAQSEEDYLTLIL